MREDERDQAFDPRLLEAPAECLLFGYFQTPRYFQGLEATLREELSTRDLGLEQGYEEVAEQLRSPGAVAVHVRRTDYAGNPNLDLCGIAYYRAAMQRMRDTVNAARFFVFSDAPAWCQRHFTDRDVEVVAHRRSQSTLTDLHLMSLAQHHIIANSTLSWWGAYLGRDRSGLTVVPDPLFPALATPPTFVRDGWVTAPAFSKAR